MAESQLTGLIANPQMSLPSVVGVVLHFRTAEQTLRCLGSLRDAGVSGAVLVDNSEDNGKSLRSMCAGLQRLRSGGFIVEILTPDTNLGFAGGVNLGLKKAIATESPSVLIINSDAYLEIGALPILRQGLLAASVAVPFARRETGEPATSLFGFYHKMFALVLHRGCVGSLRYPSGCCLLLRADLARQIQFDADFFFYGEDVMFWRELEAQGVSAVECMTATIVHRGSASAKNGSMFYEYHMNRSHWLLGIKLGKNTLEQCVFTFSRCLTLPMRAVVRSIRFLSTTPLKGLAAATLDLLRGQFRSFTPPST